MLPINNLISWKQRYLITGYWRQCNFKLLPLRSDKIALAEWISKNLFVRWCIRFVIHQLVSKRFFDVFVISVYKMDSVLIIHACSDNSNLFSIVGLRKRLGVGPLGWYPDHISLWKTCFAGTYFAVLGKQSTYTTVSAASAIKSSRMVVLLYGG